MNKEQKRFQKRKKREKEKKAALLRERANRSRWEKLSEYPSFVLGRQEADPEFIAAIIDAVKRFDFLDSKKHGSRFQTYFKLGKLYGFGAVFGHLEQISSFNSGEQQFSKNDAFVMLMRLGSELLSLVPIEIRQKHMPFNDVLVLLGVNEIQLHFSSMESVSGADGRVYFSRRRPTIELDGSNYTVAFSRHAIERICQRLNPRYLEYSAAGDIHALFSTCVYFEPVMLHGGQPAFSIFNMCGNKGFAQYALYTEGVFGEENIKAGGGELYYRVGYCPVVLEGSFAKAKTFIPPGFKSTPEYGLVLKSSMSLNEKRTFLDKISDDSGNELQRLISQENEAAKWFHNNGLPQVFQWSHEVFRPF